MSSNKENKERLVAILEEAGISGLDAWKISKSFWRRKRLRWECMARHWIGQDHYGWLGKGFHVGSRSNISDCVKYGVTVIDVGYCTILVEAKYPQK